MIKGNVITGASGTRGIEIRQDDSRSDVVVKVLTIKTKWFKHFGIAGCFLHFGKLVK